MVLPLRLSYVRLEEQAVVLGLALVSGCRIPEKLEDFTVPLPEDLLAVADLGLTPAVASGSVSVLALRLSDVRLDSASLSVWWSQLVVFPLGSASLSVAALAMWETDSFLLRYRADCNRRR